MKIAIAIWSFCFFHYHHPVLRCYCNKFFVLYNFYYVMLNIYIYSSCLNVS